MDEARRAKVLRKAHLERFRLRKQRGGEFLVMGKLITDFVYDLPCSEKKVALDVVAVHFTTRRVVDSAKVVLESAGVREQWKM
jgi:hypothetical protein